MGEPNKYGLRRDIPDPIKRIVRQKAGFGCAICGSAFGTYHHFDPKFAEARDHDPDGIVYLCRSCHDRADNRWFSEEKVRVHAANPKPFEKGFSFGAFDMQCDRPTLHVGKVVAHGCRNFLRIDGRPVLWINPPEAKGAPFRLNADLKDRNGKDIFKIIDNELRVCVDKFDVVIEGRDIKIYDSPRRIDLIVKTEPPENFYIEGIRMVTDGYTISCHEGRLMVTSPSSNTVLDLFDMTMESPLSAIDINKAGIDVGVVRD
jgi:hypothetical protein